MNGRRDEARARAGPSLAALFIGIGISIGSASARADPGAVDLPVASAPPPFAVMVTPQRTTLTLGIDTVTTLLVTATGPLAAQSVPGRRQATVGVIGPLLPGPTPGSFTAEYHVPSDRRPQSSILVVELVLPDGRRAHAATRLMLPATVDFPLRSSPDANVSLEVAGRLFGPQTADADGNVRVPIVVPPDVAFGRARAVNQFGIANQTDVNLQPRDYPRVLLWAPPDAEVGENIEIEVLAASASGAPMPPEEIDLRVESGTIRRASGIPGKAIFTFTLPEKVGTGVVALTGSTQDGSSNRHDTIALHTGPAAALNLSSDVTRLVCGSRTVAHVKIFAQDRFGNLVPASGTTLTADGQPLPIELVSDVATTKVVAPDSWQGRDRILVKAALGQILAEMDIVVTGGGPARAWLTASSWHVIGDGDQFVDVLLQVFDDRGTPTAATELDWQTEGAGAVETLPAPRFGTYAARFKPRRSLRDRAVVVVVTVNQRVTASARINVQAAYARSAAARIGVASNLGNLFGESAFVEATVPLRQLGRIGRLLSAGISVGYLHSEVTTAPTSFFFPVHVDVTQAPLLGLARLRLPGERPIELSIVGTAGVTFATTHIDPTDGSFPTSHGTARGLVVGTGVDATVVLQPGELVIGARYLYANLGRTSTGDRLAGNTMGLICDLGFRMGF